MKYALDRVVGLGATASSGLPVEYYDVDGPCAVAGSSVQLFGARQNCTVGARQPGNDQWLPATAEVTFSIENGDSSFELNAPLTGSVGSRVTITVTNVVGSTALEGSANSDGICSGGGSYPDSIEVDLFGPGQCVVTVEQFDNQDFSGSPPKSVTIEVT